MARTPASMRDPDEITPSRPWVWMRRGWSPMGQILPREVLEAPRLGAFNLHGSLLPRWRGAGADPSGDHGGRSDHRRPGGCG